MVILIVEDEALFANHIQLLVEDLEHEVMGPAADAETALALVKQQSPDLVLMDINIAGAYDGVETAELIQKEHPCPVIFITAQHDERSFLRASRLGPANFLLKPFEDIQFNRAVQLALSTQPTKQQPESNSGEGNDDEFLYIKTGHKLRKIPVDEITSVAADGHYCEVFTTANRYLIRMPFQELHERLSVDRFLKTHRGHLVNEQFVESVDLRDSEIVLTTGRRVPLAKREREGFLKRVDKL
ncbi:MAG: LytR/AlgR family response regulator transcription factor [Lewinella sp.]